MGIIILNEEKFRAGEGFVSIIVYTCIWLTCRIYLKTWIWFGVDIRIGASFGRKGAPFNRYFEANLWIGRRMHKNKLLWCKMDDTRIITSTSIIRFATYCQCLLLYWKAPSTYIFYPIVILWTSIFNTVTDTMFCFSMYAMNGL